MELLVGARPIRAGLGGSSRSTEVALAPGCSGVEWGQLGHRQGLGEWKSGYGGSGTWGIGARSVFQGPDNTGSFLSG